MARGKDEILLRAKIQSQSAELERIRHKLEEEQALTTRLGEDLRPLAALKSEVIALRREVAQVREQLADAQGFARGYEAALRPIIGAVACKISSGDSKQASR